MHSSTLNKEFTHSPVSALGLYTSCSDISQKLPQKIFKSCPKVAHFTKKLLKSCFLSTKKNQFLQLMKVNLCTTIRIIYLFIYSFLLADISIPTEMIFYTSRHFENVFRLQTADHVAHWKHTPTGNPKFRRSHKHNTLHRWQ